MSIRGYLEARSPNGDVQLKTSHKCSMLPEGCIRCHILSRSVVRIRSSPAGRRKRPGLKRILRSTKPFLVNLRERRGNRFFASSHFQGGTLNRSQAATGFGVSSLNTSSCHIFEPVSHRNRCTGFLANFFPNEVFIPGRKGIFAQREASFLPSVHYISRKNNPCSLSRGIPAVPLRLAS